MADIDNKEQSELDQYLNDVEEVEEEETVPESGDLDDDAEAILAADFEIGHFLRDRIIPRSVLYFTGKAIEEDDDDYDEEGEEADEEAEEDEENDPDYDPKKEQNPAKCKQQ
ncbi:Nucleosome assembly protein 1-like 1 [Heterocephalus glaber]|uniref:Nucleosome assembly protein 1-like 1 n=1 Tax=Heterocephalus glaber TaxID=10181 RepID=G5BGX8_HETGA|nr:Nucleosome assembly protein 1-like 1 [Heterocephalus glaber]